MAKCTQVCNASYLIICQNFLYMNELSSLIILLDSKWNWTVNGTCVVYPVSVLNYRYFVESAYNLYELKTASFKPP